MYKLTLQDLRNWYNTFNKQYFKGELKIPILGISHTRRALGDFGGIGNLPRIRISTYFQRTKHSFQQTLLHEMIHLWQWQFKMVDKNHGFDFKRKAREINKDGWGISRTSILTEEEMDSAASIECYLMVWVNGDKISYARLANSSTYLYEEYKNLLDCCTLISVRGTQFSTLRNCKKKVSYYTITVDEFKEKIEPYIIRKHAA